MKIQFIIKPFSSQKKTQEFQEELVKFKETTKVKIKQVFTTPDGENNAQNLAKKAIEQEFDKIVFVGGDGLLNEGVNGIMQATGGNFSPDFTIGIIPTGSGNNFAKELGIPKDIKTAFEIIKKGKTTLVDIGKVNDRYFINCFSVGFDAQINNIANHFKEKYAFLPKEESYFFAALLMIAAKLPNFEIKMKSKEINYQGKIILAAITNSQSYGGKFLVNPGAKINDGIFNICVIEPVGKLRALFDLYKASQGTHIYLPEVKTFRFSFPLTITSPRFLPCEADGEVLEPKKEYKIRIFPKTLRICVPSVPGSEG
jgi:YegS/Rv2252/BmrU family lipid kinase